jgi:hypothetical protein
MNSLRRDLQSIAPGKWKTILRIFAVAGALVVGPAAWNGLAPVVLLLLQVLLGLGQMCLTILRINGF